MSDQTSDPWYKSLRFRLAALLSIALLPIGLIAVIQTLSVVATARSNAEMALLALTQQAATDERLALMQAIGGADALAVVVPELSRDLERCSVYMSRYVARSERFSFAGFIPTSGLMECSSTGEPFDASGSADFAEMVADPHPRFAVNPAGPISGTSVVIARTPVYGDAGELLGFVAISIPHAMISATTDTAGDALRELITFSKDGTLLTAAVDLASAPNLLPPNLDLASFVTRNAAVSMRGEDVNGYDRIYTVAPIRAGEVYVMGIWDENAGITNPTARSGLAIVFPVLMWGVSLLVALFAVHRLVTRHLQQLGRQMALFAAARRLPADVTTEDPPTEIRRMQQAFYRMTDALIRDEANLENAIREKSVLVKEIHHRVKNNLQLISSIIALQIRDADSFEAKAALRQTQDRVLSMATIHRDLYQTSATGLVDVGHLMREVVTNSLAVSPEYEGIALDMAIEDVWLYPDQAVPMSLLAAEAVINALKHMPDDGQDGAPGGARWMRVAFRKDPDRQCHFSLENSAPEVPPGQGKGMGRKLIRAFATQLGATVRARHEAGRYELAVEFEASEFAPAPGDF